MSRTRVFRLVDLFFSQDSSQITKSSRITSFVLKIGFGLGQDLKQKGRHSSTLTFEKWSLKSAFDLETRRWTVFVVWLKLSMDLRKREFLRGRTGSRSLSQLLTALTAVWNGRISWSSRNDRRKIDFRERNESDFDGLKSSALLKFLGLKISEHRRRRDFLRRKTTGDLIKGSFTIFDMKLFRFDINFRKINSFKGGNGARVLTIRCLVTHQTAC